MKRISGAFQAKPKEDKVADMAKKLGIPMTPELMQLGNNEAISNALVEIAVGMGKTEAEIGAALTDWAWKNIYWPLLENLEKIISMNISKNSRRLK